MSDDLTFTDPAERWHRAWFVGPLTLDFGVRAAPTQRKWWQRRASPESRFSGQFRLSPVCLGHLIYLQALDSPILRLGMDDVDIGIPDFLAAIRILRDARWPFTAAIDFSHDAGDELLLQAHLAARQAQPGADGAPSVSPIESALQSQFLPWWFACQAGPEMMQSEDGGRVLGAPVALGMAIRLLRTGNFTEERIFTMPLSLLRYYVAAIGEQEGSGSGFLTREIIEAMRELSEQRDPETMTEDEIFELAKKDMGEDRARDFMAVRAESKAKAAAQAAADAAPAPIPSKEEPAHG